MDFLQVPRTFSFGRTLLSPPLWENAIQSRILSNFLKFRTQFCTRELLSVYSVFHDIIIGASTCPCAGMVHLLRT